MPCLPSAQTAATAIVPPSLGRTLAVAGTRLVEVALVVLGAQRGHCHRR